MVGAAFILTCTVTVPAQLVTEPVISYQWLKGNQPIQDETMKNLSFVNLTLKDAADYTCEVNVTDSSLINDTTTITNRSRAYPIMLICKYWIHTQMIYAYL